MRKLNHIIFACMAFASATSFGAAPPNIVIFNIDDMGYGDLPTYGNTDPIKTPNLDALAHAGLQFRQFYVNSPLCSSSRAGLLTGQYPSRWNINSYLDTRSDNIRRDTADYLSLQAPSLARTLQQQGYTTGHFGKWHMGGGRDVGNAPLPTAYGFNESFVQFEGLGDRALIVGDGLSNASAKLGQGRITWVDSKNELSALFVDKAIDFIDRNASAPFYVNVWPDDVHDPYDPKPELVQKYVNLGVTDPDLQKYYATMDDMDSQFGRLMKHIDDAGLGDNTIIMVLSDNGPTAAGGYYHTGQGDFSAPGSTDGLRGRKSSLYEGGVREPLIVRWSGKIAPGVNDRTVVTAADFLPSLTSVTGAPLPAAQLDGKDMSAELLGQSNASRQTSVFWDYGRNSNNIKPFLATDKSPNLAMRQGDWKLLMNGDGSKIELYDLSSDRREQHNLAASKPALVQNMSRELLAWRYQQPSIVPPGFQGSGTDPRLIVQLKAESIAGADGAAVSNWADTAASDSFAGSVSQTNAAARPIKRLNAINGKAAVEFDGVNDVLASTQNNSLTTAASGVTIFLIATADPSGETAERAMQLGSSTGASGSMVGVDLSSSATSTDNGGAGFRFNDGRSSYDAGIDNSQFHILAFRVPQGQSYANATMYVDGTLPANTFSGNSTNATATTSFSGANLELLLGTGRLSGGGLAANDYFGGKIAELLVYNEQLSVEQINLVANYLSSQYALPFAYRLPAHIATADFDADGDVDGADLLSWQRGNGLSRDATFVAGDADGDGDVDSADLSLWQSQVAQSLAAKTGQGAPELSAKYLMFTACLALWLRP
jgi:arylsulfatase A-like enzyme